MIESVQKFASMACLKQWSRNTRYQDMLVVLNMPYLATHRRKMKLCKLLVLSNHTKEYLEMVSLLSRKEGFPYANNMEEEVTDIAGAFHQV